MDFSQKNIFKALTLIIFILVGIFVVQEFALKEEQSTSQKADRKPIVIESGEGVTQQIKGSLPETATSSTSTPSNNMTSTSETSTADQVNFDFSERSTTYSISNPNLPFITEFTLDPFDAKEGEKQLGVVRLRTPNVVKEVSLYFRTDNKEETYTLQKKSDIEGGEVWSGTWQLNDTINSRYNVEVQAKTSEGESSVDLHFK